ncbi:conserved hypothetical protein [Talaromyces stipitatus ATCC 10500]|uniref:CREG-like beta-barrel domain-containing protein n=1 Tax=Talaromyces stipitatus (strain ATCC 10500 / CBS 375.48 / QM 6759 / NRRL 1006) TaxID=441959 RepID=B8MKI4_TALSN|nr:uncharacterized protein TSTA_047850 [Talaromyces stipitatus ATCC 10500]EED15339.1 conserved hypothetical protein [Talaromyces stipitatus ATCC 10500]
MAQGHLNILTLLSAAILCLYLPSVLGTPFIVTPRREDGLHQQKDQTALLQHVGYQGNSNNAGRDDPLKDFISDVVHDSVVPVAPPASIPLPSPPMMSSLRYAGNVDGLDNITIGLHRIADGEELDGDEETAADDEEELSTLRRPSWFDSVLLARRLLAKSSIGIASTVYQHTDSSSSAHLTGLEGVPISLPEYIADCSEIIDSNNNNGNPILLGLYVSTTFRNIAKGSNISLSIDWWNHLNDTKPVYPGFPLSEAGLPRISLIGYVERLDLSSTEKIKDGLEECFFAIHPDAKVWAPGNPDSPHSGFWARMVVTRVYWIGGFGDLQQIGWINMTDWRGVGRYESASSIGDGSGRGWEDIRLPGE